MANGKQVGCCDEASSFFAANGDRIHSLRELSDSLEHMDEGCFMHHVHEGRNDFANWARDVLKDEELATMLESAKEKKSAQIAVLKTMMKHAVEVLR